MIIDVKDCPGLVGPVPYPFALLPVQAYAPPIQERQWVEEIIPSARAGLIAAQRGAVEILAPTSELNLTGRIESSESGEATSMELDAPSPAVAVSYQRRKATVPPMTPDGLLLYVREASYVHGETPLAGWIPGTVPSGEVGELPLDVFER